VRLWRSLWSSEEAAWEEASREEGAAVSVQPEEAVKELGLIVKEIEAIPEPHTYTDFKQAQEILKSAIVRTATILSNVMM